MKMQTLPFRRGAICLAAVAMAALAGTAEAQSAKAFFKDGPGLDRVDQYPGTAGEGWVTAWTIRKGKTVDLLATAEGAPANPRLNIRMSVLDGALDFNNGAVVRRYDHAEKDHTISFKIRVEKTEGLSESSDFLGVFGGGEPASNFTSESTWAVRTIGKTPEQWRWAAYEGTADGGPFTGMGMKEIGGWKHGLKVETGKTYTFTITNRPQKGTYDVRVSDGESTVESQDLKYRAAEANWAPMQAGLGFQAQGSAAGNLFVFSVSEVVIAPAP